ncbi:hypothetical protein LTR97_007945 [Elasticomyces elasticus]|uniref:Uncharacterized protein n=1 Tax=Elasticomyces elasticus TaxID=574655 RepID=A0AAN7W8Q1_9PEZI|nr:hypothetical protein LTR97_007945 [Elasticomyces elasticus]
MLACNLARTYIRPTVRPAFATTYAPRSGFNSLAKHNGPEVPVISYEGGCRHEEILSTPVSKTSGPVNPVGADEQKKAYPLSPSAFKYLTPTLSKFTLPGKVAVITGEQTGVDVRFYRVDVRDGQAIQQTCQDIADHYGGLDVLINAAGIADSNIKAEVYDHEKWRRLLDINITGTFFVAQACGTHMILSGKGGSIINIASMSGSIVNYPQEQSCYNASKAAVIMLTKSLAAEWAPYGIRVNSISPGYMDTALNHVPALDAQKRIWVDHTPQKRLGAVDDLNNLAVYLASEGSDYMTGNNCIIDGGYTLW